MLGSAGAGGCDAPGHPTPVNPAQRPAWSSPPPRRPAAPLAACVTGLTLLAFLTNTPLSTAATRSHSLAHGLGSAGDHHHLHLTLDCVGIARDLRTRC